MTTNGVGPDRSPQGRRARFYDAERLSESGMTYNPTTDTYTARFESLDASVAVTKGLADVRKCDVTDLDPLYESLDPDALDRLVASASDSMSISFTVDGFDVAIVGGKFLEVSAPT